MSSTGKYKVLINSNLSGNRLPAQTAGIGSSQTVSDSPSQTDLTCSTWEDLASSTREDRVSSTREGLASSGLWKMVLEGNTSAISAPGQFINIAVPGNYLRRPISICDWDEKTITIIYRVVGAGTYDLSRISVGDILDAIVGLGNGFSQGDVSTDFTPLLIGGGVGLPPMLGLAKSFLKRGVKPIVLAGFSSKDDAILINEFEALGLCRANGSLYICTMDGSLGTKGTVMELIDAEACTVGRQASVGTPSCAQHFDKFYACGPKPMLKALMSIRTDGELSVEERMGCGFGICMGCSCKTRHGMKRICKEGPVFAKEELLWE